MAQIFTTYSLKHFRDQSTRTSEFVDYYPKYNFLVKFGRKFEKMSRDENDSTTEIKLTIH
jgi:hypothetical protein